MVSTMQACGEVYTMTALIMKEREWNGMIERRRVNETLQNGGRTHAFSRSRL